MNGWHGMTKTGTCIVAAVMAVVIAAAATVVIYRQEQIAKRIIGKPDFAKLHALMEQNLR